MNSCISNLEVGTDQLTLLLSFPEPIVVVNDPPESFNQFVMRIQKFIYQKWYITIKLLINTYYIISNLTSLVDNDADLNCIQEEIMPSKFFEKTMQKFRTADRAKA